MRHNDVVKMATLRELATAGSVRSVSVVGQKGGYAVNVRYGMAERTLAGKDGEARLFKTIDTAANTLRELGIASFDVDAVNFEPGRLRPARPDLAERMRGRHEAGAHDEWFRSQVQASLDKPDPQFVPHDAAVAQLLQYADTLTKAKPTPRQRAAVRKAVARKAR
ncbi:hypothetical protein X12_004532 (plasmid) [Xanthomonas arboricola]|uniref:hypothetical protein n=1 Tax=Xanthomonas arboricola TaxID=56448 RepID=UPI002B2E88E5|nr:hypothetical protein X12_004532 [Xanthomonas arboricola]